MKKPKWGNYFEPGSNIISTKISLIYTIQPKKYKALLFYPKLKYFIFRDSGTHFFQYQKMQNNIRLELLLLKQTTKICFVIRKSTERNLSMEKTSNQETFFTHTHTHITQSIFLIAMPPAGLITTHI